MTTRQVSWYGFLMLMFAVPLYTSVETVSFSHGVGSAIGFASFAACALVPQRVTENSITPWTLIFNAALCVGGVATIGLGVIAFFIGDVMSALVCLPLAAIFFWEAYKAIWQPDSTFQRSATLPLNQIVRQHWRKRAR